MEINTVNSALRVGTHLKMNEGATGIKEDYHRGVITKVDSTSGTFHYLIRFGDGIIGWRSERLVEKCYHPVKA